MWIYTKPNEAYKLFKIWHASYECYESTAKQIYGNNSKSLFHVPHHQETKNTTKKPRITTTLNSLAEKLI